MNSEQLPNLPQNRLKFLVHTAHSSSQSNHHASKKNVQIISPDFSDHFDKFTASKFLLQSGLTSQIPNWGFHCYRFYARHQPLAPSSSSKEFNENTHVAGNCRKLNSESGHR
jgi:hypothetical protein